MNKFKVEAYIALGSNLGDRFLNLKKALELLDECDGVRVAQTSDFIETQPLAGLDQPYYLNAVTKIETTLTAQELLKNTQKIESALGRVRSDHWGSRIIDLDLIFYGSQISKTDDLVIPHPQMHLRSFVLEPLASISPEFIHPVLNRTVSELADRLNGGNFFLNKNVPSLIEMAGVIGVGKSTLTAGLVEYFDGEFIREEYDTNPYLPKVYAGQEEFALDSDLFFLRSASRQLAAENLNSEKINIADYIFEKTLIYAEYWLNSTFFAEYQKHYNAQRASVVHPSLVIFLDDELDCCVQRIKERARPYEQNVSFDLLKKLQDDYRLLMDKWTKSPVLRVKASDFDFRNKEDVIRLAEEVRHYI